MGVASSQARRQVAADLPGMTLSAAQLRGKALGDVEDAHAIRRLPGSPRRRAGAGAGTGYRIEPEAVSFSP